MSTRERRVDHGAERGRGLVQKLATELRRARRDRGLSQEAVARAAGISRTRESFIERALANGVGVAQWSRLLAIVGLELSVQTFPTLEPIRDAAHANLLERLRTRLHPSLRWRTEVPMPIPGDLRGWDGLVRGGTWRVGVEAETGPQDLQALKRRVALKQRDSEVNAVVLLLGNTRRNRALIRTYADPLAQDFPVFGRRALELLAAGVFPGGSALILL